MTSFQCPQSPVTYRFTRQTVYTQHHRCLQLAHISDSECTLWPQLIIEYSLEIWIASDESLEDIRIKQKRSL